MWAIRLGVCKGKFVLFRGYIDESFDSKQNIFALSCILAKGSDWMEFERKWKLHLAAKNRELKKADRPLISRYHASDCSGRYGEFEGWSRDERDKFVLGLFQVFSQVPTFTVVYDVQVDELCGVFCEAFPDMAKDRLEATYHWLTTFMLIQIGKDLNGTTKNGSAIRFKLFHDQTGGNGRYDPTILRAFNKLMNDKTFSHREKFTKIAPLRWQDCIALQPADLVAFECFKQAEARLEARKSRKSFDALLNLGSFGIHSKTVNKEALEHLRELLVADVKRRNQKVENA
jgi:hypothetical protein